MSTLAISIKLLDPFQNLRSLSINFKHEGLATQHTYAKLLLSLNSTNRLEMLNLTSLCRIDVPLIKIVAASFPLLRVLHLSCTERLIPSCCWVCFEEAASSLVHSPVPDMFATSRDLAVRYKCFS